MKQPLSTSHAWRLVIASRNFRILFTAELVSTFGDILYKLAIMWFIYQRTGSAMQTGGVAIAGLLGTLLVGFLIGTLVDRWNRKTILVVADLVRAILVASLVVAMLLADQPPLWLFYGVSFALSIVGMFFGSARSAAMPDLLASETLLAANIAANMASRMMGVAFTAIAGLLIAWIGPEWAMALNALSFVFSAVWLLWLPSLAATTPKAPRAVTPKAIWQDMREGIDYLRLSHLLGFLSSIVIVVNFGSALYSTLTPALVTTVLNADPSVYGLLSTASLVGGIIGGLLLQMVGQKLSLNQSISLGLIGASLSALSLGWSTWVPLSLFLTTTMSMALVFNQMPVYTALQRETPSHLRGRVFNLFGMIANIANPLGIALGSALADQIGVQWVYSIGAALVAFGAWRALYYHKPQPDPRSEGALL